VIESYICATEAQEKNPALLKEVERILPYATGTYVSHEEFKKLTEKAKYVVRTGENSPYANIILVGGVNF
jgi:D-ribose pyranase